MCQISIIVPVYNVEKYLRKCVDSILNQTFTDFEVILVDDGSPDNSGKICDEYAKIDSRVRVIHKKNGGLSDARNAGIDIAQGEYLGFVDSDDYITADMYELLYRNIKSVGAELAICGIYDVYRNKEIKKIPSFLETVDKVTAMKLVLDAKIVSVHAVNKLYKKELFLKVRYPKGKITEDAAVILQLLNQCHKVSIDSSQKYYYFHRDDSISSKQFSKKDLDTIEVWKDNEVWINKHYPALVTEVHTRVCWAHFVVLDKIVLTKDKKLIVETRQIRKYLMSNFLFIMQNKRLTVQRKLSMCLLALSISAYKIPVVLQYKKIKSVN